MSDVASFRIDQRGSVRWIVVNRPDKRNAMTNAMGAGLGELLDDAAADDSTRVVVITGAGDAFSAGLDRDEIAKGLAQKSLFPVETLVQFEKPTIACVNGLAFGGGATMAMACDMRVMAESATFTFGLGRVGLTPEWGSSYLLWRQVGWSRAIDLFLTGRKIDAGEALRIGLVDRVEPDGNAADATQALAEQIASLPFGTAEATKHVLRRGLDVDFIQAREIERDTLAERTKALREMRKRKDDPAG